MRDPQQRTGPGGGRREIGVWPLVIGAAIVIAIAVWFFLDVGVQQPVPLPDSPAAQGTTGAASGVTGATPEPGAPVGSDAPPDAPAVQPNPDLAPGTGVDTTRGN